MKKDLDQKPNNLHEGEEIIDYSFDVLMGDRFGRYAKYIIQERALPDVRDGLKPVQRRILYGMKMLKLTSDRPYMKSARVVGDVMGKYHPHGDSSIYEALVRMSQDWKMNLPLIDMQGNNGSMDGDPAAAYRYTEARLQPVANLLLNDLDKKTVDFAPNYDDKDVEPTVLPAYLPNILVNGSTGIAAGYATNMPPHNLGEVVDVLVALIENPNLTLPQAMKLIKAPDFPTGGVLQQLDGVKEAFATGKGRVIVNAKWHREKNLLVIDEIPYEVIKQDLVKKIGEVADNNPGLGIKNILDETDKKGLRIVIELNPKANFETVRKFLFKNTALSIAYNYNNVVIIDKQPKQVGLLPILKAYLEHSREVYTKKATFELNEAKRRLEIIEGLVKAMSALDQVIAIIRKSQNRKDAMDNLREKFEFTKLQAEAIVDMRLYRLTSTDVEALHKEADELRSTIARLQKILRQPKELDAEMIRNLTAVKAQFAIPRRSEISLVDESFEVDLKDTVVEKNYTLFVSRDGYLKALDAATMAKNEWATFGRKPGDIMIAQLEVSNMEHLLLMSSAGQYFSIPLFKLANSKWKDLGVHVNEFAPMSGEEKLVSALVIQDFAQNHQQVLVTTKMGAIKRVPIKDFETKLFSKPFRLIKLSRPSDEVVSADLVTAKTHNVVVVNEKGFGVRYDINDIPVQGLGSKGVKASSVVDAIVGGHAFELNQDLVILTNKNQIKRISQSEIPMFVRPKKGTRLFADTSKKVPDGIKFSFAVHDEATIHFLNEENELNDLAVKKIKASSLDKKPHALDFGNLIDASLGTGFRGNNLDRLSHETVETETEKTEPTVDLNPKVKTSQANMSFDFHDAPSKEAIDQKYDDSLYSMFDDILAPTKNKDEVEDPTQKAVQTDPRKKDA